MLFTNTAYTKDQDIHDQESFRKSGFLYSALESPIQHCMVTAVTFVVRRSPKGKHRFTEVKPCFNIPVHSSAYDAKIFIILFERAFKMMKNYFIVIALLVAE